MGCVVVLLFVVCVVVVVDEFVVVDFCVGCVWCMDGYDEVVIGDCYDLFVVWFYVVWYVGLVCGVLDVVVVV